MGMKLCRLARSMDMCNKVNVGNENTHIYHEKQVRELCAMHAMNSLLQDKDAFNQKSLDKICNDLSPSYFFNPHKSMFGTGNYDVNVLMAAMNSKGYELIWFDKRKDVAELNLANIVGFILNLPSDYKLGGVIPLSFNRRHWVAVRKVCDTYYNLDSKLKDPEVIGDDDCLRQYLRSHLQRKDKELLFVVSQEANNTESWKLDVHKNQNGVDGNCIEVHGSEDKMLDS